MSEDLSFHDLIRKVRAGDQEAAAELVRQYESAVRRAVRFRLVDPRLRRVLDSLDICQAVLASFFVRTALGQYELGTPDDLLRLLVAMARNKVAKEARRQRAERRDNRRDAAGSAEARGVAAPGASPSKQVEAKEQLEAVRRRLTEDEWQLVQLRNEGHDWGEIAARLGGQPDALRMKLTRAVKRVTAALDCDEVSHE